MLKKLLSGVFLLLFMLSFNTGDLNAKKRAVIVKGKVSFFKGTGYILRSGRTLPLKTGMNVFENDTVITKRKSIVVVKFRSGNQIKITANSTVTLNLLHNKKNKTGIHIHKGGLYARVKKLGSRGYRVDTPTAVAGVRGTTFYVESSSESTVNKVAVKSGTVEVKNNQNGSKALVGKDFAVNFNSDEIIKKPEAYKWIKKLNWNLSPLVWKKKLPTSKVNYKKLNHFKIQ